MAEEAQRLRTFSPEAKSTTRTADGRPKPNNKPLPAPFTRIRLEPALGGKLVAHDLSALVGEKQAEHLQGTREWAFAGVFDWLDDPSEPQLMWYKGGGGTGKSVRALPRS